VLAPGVAAGFRRRHCDPLMGNRRTVSLVLIFLSLILLWDIGTRWYAERRGWNTTIADNVEEIEPTTRPGAIDATTTRPSTQPDFEFEPPTETDGLAVVEGEAQQIILGGDKEADESPFAIRLTLSSVGAGIDEALLKAYAAEVDEPDRYRFEVPYEASPDENRPLATQTVTINGETLDLSNVAWNVQESDDRRAVFYVDVLSQGQRVARVQKVVRLFPKVDADGNADPRGGYELRVLQSVKNYTAGPITYETTLNGTTTPPRELEGMYDQRTVLRGQLEDGRVRYEAEQVEAFDEDEPQRIYDLGIEPLAWAGSGTIYFNAIVRPEDPGQVERFVAEAINPQSDDAEREVRLRLESDEFEIAAGETQVLPLRVFLGPKKRDLLENDYYSAARVRYNATLISPFGCTFCVFQPVVDILVFLLSIFHAITFDWGLAIILLVFLVRTLLHPITRKSQKNIMKMSKMAPKIQAAKEKYGDDKEKMAAAMAEMAPEQTQAVLFGCLPMLLQTPIWIALYSTLQATFELRHEPFFYGLTWIDDLAKPDHLIQFENAYPLLFGFTITGLNILPLLMGLVFYLQMKLQPQPTATMTPEQKAQQRLIQIMMVTLFPLFLYSAPSGLNLYILTSTAFGIIETKLIRANLKREEDELEAAKARGETIPEKPKGPIGRRLDAFKDTLGTRIAEAQKQAQAHQAAQKKGGGSKPRPKKR
jgi:YidC/Oxa1 family membrane protein insertase